MAKAKPPTAKQRARWQRIVELGCCIPECRRIPGIHHALTGAGGRKDHDKVMPLCHHHHQGDEGIDAKHNGSPQSKKAWQAKYGTEQYFLDWVAKQLGETGEDLTHICGAYDFHD